MHFRPSAESLAVFTRPLLTCCAITALIHAATYMLMVLLPLHLVHLGGTKMQVGMLFSTAASLAVAAVLLATGGSVLYPTLLALVVDRAPARERGLAVGTLSGAFDLGVVVGSLLLGLVVERISYGAGFAMAATTTALGLLTFVAMERRRLRPAVLPRPFTGV